MEEGVVNEILQGPLRDVFDSKQLITDISGSGNNWWEYAEHKNSTSGAGEIVQLDRELVLHMADMGSVPGNAYDPLNPPKMILKHSRA